MKRIVNLFLVTLAVLFLSACGGSGDPTPTYTLTYSAGDHGTLSGSTSQSVKKNKSGTAVRAVPNNGYHFVNWSDGSAQNPRTDTNIQSNLSVTAHFEVNPTPTYTLTYRAGEHGTLSGNTSQSVKKNKSGTAVRAVANNGYHFTTWSDGSTQNPRTDTNIQSNLSVTAHFEVNQASNKRIFILGESTVHAGWWHSLSTRPIDKYGENRVLEGWGEELARYMKDPSKVHNRACSGSTSVLYRKPSTFNIPGTVDRYWTKTETEINATDDNNGGFLLIQFGSNDALPTANPKVSVPDFKKELKAYIADANRLGLTPVLISPPTVRNPDEDFNHRDYAAHVKSTAEEANVLFLNLFEKSKEEYKLIYNSNDSNISKVDEVFSYVHHHNGINVAHLGRNGAKIVAGWVRDLACDSNQYSDKPEKVQNDARQLCSQFVQGELEHHITMREDAEDADIDGWERYGTTEGSTVANVYDANKRSNVIVLQGNDGLNNGFRYNRVNPWEEENQLVVSWEMNATEDFTFFVAVDTEDGYKTFEYKPTDDADAIVNGRYRFGLGSNANDGTWHTFTRDIQADLKSLDPTKNILKIHRIAVRGSGSIDNIRTMQSIDSVSRDIAPTVAIKGFMNVDVNQSDAYIDAGFTAVDDNDADIEEKVETIDLDSVDTDTIGTYTIYYRVHDSVGNGGYAKRIVNVINPNAETVVVHEDAEDENKDGWWDDEAISNVADHGGRVIHFGGHNGPDDAYAMNVNGVTSGFVTSWAMKSTEEFKFIVKVATQHNGDVYITYMPKDIDEGYETENGKNYAKFALGDDANDGEWHTFTRDIVADLHKVKENYVIRAITRFYVRGNGSIDDITTSTRGSHATFNYGGHSYEIVKTPTSWQDASAAAQNKGGYLVRVDSHAENHELYSRLFRYINPEEYQNTIADDGGTIPFAWIGGSDSASEGEWKWSDNDATFYTGDNPVAGMYYNWGRTIHHEDYHEPDNWTNHGALPDGQDFAAMAIFNHDKHSANGNGRNWGWGLAGQWNDVAVGNELYYIIEYDDEPAVKKIFLIGDSTIQNNRNTIWGIGDKLDTYMKTPGNKFNYARPGSSTKSYRPDRAGTVNDWPGVLSKIDETDITKGAYMFIHFGHNDATRKENLYAAPGRNNAFYNNLKGYVDEIRDLGITPVLVTPISYMYRDDNHHGTYPQTTIDLAADENVLLLDLTKKTFNEFKKYPSDASLLSAFSRGETEEGVQDRTHFSEQGALKIAGWLKELICESPDQVLCNQFKQ